MDNLWLLTEERPKPSVVTLILRLYCDEFSEEILESGIVKIKPIIENGVFKFLYQVEGLRVGNVNKIYLKTVSGSSSFVDYLIFKQLDEPLGDSLDNPIMAIEETKTSDVESRNTGVYQRGSKFVYIRHYYPNIKLYMLYNEELGDGEDKKPSDTSVFGSNMLLTLGVTIIGKNTTRWFQPFESLEDLIKSKCRMRKPPEGNVPINITKRWGRIEISGRLSKPASEGNIGHDPNIGALTLISSCIRHLGWDKEILITDHGVSQEYLERCPGNKFLFICDELDIKLKDRTLPKSKMPQNYWHYEKSSEKVASILLHTQCENHGMCYVYENHAGCERGYFRAKDGEYITLPKKDSKGDNLFLPDVVLYDPEKNLIVLVEGKKYTTISQGINELDNYDSIEDEYIKRYYPGSTVIRGLSIFGGKQKSLPHPKVLFYLNEYGQIVVNHSAPDCIKIPFR